jgi:hypothetical protein
MNVMTIDPDRLGPLSTSRQTSRVDGDGFAMVGETEIVNNYVA